MDHSFSVEKQDEHRLAGCPSSHHLVGPDASFGEPLRGCLFSLGVKQGYPTFICCDDLLKKSGVSFEEVQILSAHPHTICFLSLCQNPWHEFGTELCEFQVLAQQMMDTGTGQSSALTQLLQTHPCILV